MTKSRVCASYVDIFNSPRPVIIRSRPQSADTRGLAPFNAHQGFLGVSWYVRDDVHYIKSAHQITRSMVVAKAVATSCLGFMDMVVAKAVAKICVGFMVQARFDNLVKPYAPTVRAGGETTCQQVGDMLAILSTSSRLCVCSCIPDTFP
jgi:hypothetical protein